MVQCYKNARYVESCSIMDRALHYGDGCFTTARLYNNALLLKSRHWARLNVAAQHLSLKVDFKLIDQSLAQLQAQHPLLNGTLKIIVSRGIGDRGYRLPDHPADIYVFYYPLMLSNSDHHDALTAMPPPELIQSGVLSLKMGLSMPSLVGLKSLNRLEQVMLRQEADQQSWIEALVTDVQNQVVEGVSSNCFFKINDAWITPELRYNGVHGVMRAEILQRMQQQQIICTPRLVYIDEIDQIQSLFFCNALAPMKIVDTLNTRTLAIQPCVELFQTLQLDHFTSYAQN